MHFNIIRTSADAEKLTAPSTFPKDLSPLILLFTAMLRAQILISSIRILAAAEALVKTDRLHEPVELGPLCC